MRAVIERPVTVVVATRDRLDDLVQTFEQWRGVAAASAGELPPFVVVDNGSTDATVRALRRSLPSEAQLLALPGNLGAAGRNAGARRAATPLVAFADDDSWWAPGALEEAAALFERHPRLGLVAARVVVEPGAVPDPACVPMASSPLPAPLVAERGEECRRVLGFLACGSMVRRHAFLAAGGFRPEYVIGAEESLLAIDLVARGWDVVFAPHVVVHHRPSAVRQPGPRRRLQARNALWTAWTRRWPASALRHTRAVFGEAAPDPASLRGAADALAGLPWVLANREPVPAGVAAMLDLLDRTGR